MKRAGTPPREPSRTSKAQSVLLVSANRSLCDSLTKALVKSLGKDLDVDYHFAVEGAVTRIKEGGYELVFVDHHLGTSSGVDLIRDAAKEIPGVACILVTQHRYFDAALAAIDVGAADYLFTNEISYHTLERTIRHAKSVIGRGGQPPLLRQVRTATGGLDEQIDKRLTPSARGNVTSLAVAASRLGRRARTPGRVPLANCSSRILQLIVDQLPHAVFWLDTNSVCLGCNATFAALVGVPSPDHAIGKDASALWAHVPGAEEVTQALLRASVGAGTERAQFIPPHDDPQGERIFGGMILPLHGPRNEPFGVLGLLQDITEQKRSDSALRSSEAKLRMMLQQLPAIVWTVDRQQFVTPYIGPNFPVPAEGMLETGKQIPLTSYFGSDDPHAPPLVAVRRALGGDSASFDMPWAGYEYRVYLEPFRDAKGEIEGCLGLTVDVSEQKRTEAALRGSEERYRRLADSSPVGIWHVDVRGFTIYVNQKMCDLLQISGIDELRSRSHLSFFSVQTLQQLHLEADSWGLGLAPCEIELVGKQQRRLDCMVTSVPMFGPDGEVHSYLSTYLDITAQKSVLEEQIRLEAQMHHTQKLESLGVLAGGIAHDFNNLLLGILGNASLASMELPSESKAAYRINQVRKAAERASELTNQLLAYSGKGVHAKQPLNVSSVLEEMCGLLEPVITKKAAIRYDLTIDLPAVEADPGQLRQVVMNLVTNASDALRDSAGTIVVRTGVLDADRSYLCEAHNDESLREGRYVFFEVSDTGCGMDPATVPRIFDPFFTTKVAGRGLGLAAVLSIVRFHGGAVKVATAPGRGTTFRVLFPVLSGVPAQRIVVEGQSVKDWRGEGVILVVDDEPVVQDVARVTLERFGFSVILAGDGRAAVDLYRQYRGEVRAILLDLTMPVMDGDKALEQLRSISPTVPVVLSSGYSRHTSVNELLRDRSTTFIQKPYRPVALIETLRQVLS